MVFFHHRFYDDDTLKKLLNVTFEIFISTTEELGQQPSLIVDRIFLHEVTTEEQMIKMKQYITPVLAFDSTFTLSHLPSGFCGKVFITGKIEDSSKVGMDIHVEDNVKSLEAIISCPGDIILCGIMEVEKVYPGEVLPKPFFGSREKITLNPFKTENIMLSFDAWNVGMQDLQYQPGSEFLVLELSGFELSASWTYVTSLKSSWISHTAYHFKLLLSLSPHIENCKSIDLSKKRRVLKGIHFVIKVLPNPKHPDFYHKYDSLSSNNQQEFDVEIDCRGLLNVDMTNFNDQNSRVNRTFDMSFFMTYSYSNSMLGNDMKVTNCKNSCILNHFETFKSQPVHAVISFGCGRGKSCADKNYLAPIVLNSANWTHLYVDDDFLVAGTLSTLENFCMPEEDWLSFCATVPAMFSMEVSILNIRISFL